MTHIRFQQTVMTEYEVDLDLPASVTDHLAAGYLLDSLDDNAAIDLYEALTGVMTSEHEIDRRSDETVITNIDLPGHTLILPFELTT